MGVQSFWARGPYINPKGPKEYVILGPTLYALKYYGAPPLVAADLLGPLSPLPLPFASLFLFTPPRPTSDRGDDCQSLIWDLSCVPSSVPKAVEDPILAYTAEEQVNQLQWSASHPEWIAIAFANKMQILRV